MLSKQKYSRAAKDQSQLQQFVDEVCEESKRLLPEVKSGDAHKVLKIKADGSGTEYDFVDISELTANGEIPASIKALIESLSGTSLKQGYYIHQGDNFVLVEDIPEDYEGVLFIFKPDDDTISMGYWSNGDYEYNIGFGDLSFIQVYQQGSGYTEISANGVNKLNFTQLTHSFNELDPTLREIVDDAVDDNWANGVACTGAQWNAIKSLLDKALYINYMGYSMIKSSTDGLSNYIFGRISSTENMGAVIEMRYDNSSNLLFVHFLQL